MMNCLMASFMSAMAYDLSNAAPRHELDLCTHGRRVPDDDQTERARLCSASIVFVCHAVDEQLRHAAQNPIDALLRADVNAQLILRLVKRRQGET